jgi:hypothetical protein
MHTIFVDRDLGKKAAVLTLQYASPNGNKKVFERLPVATGQFPFLDGGADDWVQGKGGTPYGSFWMTTKKEPLQMEPKGSPFYVISSEKGSRIIKGPNGKQRSDIGLHKENQYPGSAGCTVLLHDTPERECLVNALFAYLDTLHPYEPYIRFIVL